MNELLLIAKRLFRKSDSITVSASVLSSDGIVQQDCGKSSLSIMEAPQSYSMLNWTIIQQIKGILPEGAYLPCVSMAGRALLAGYPRNASSIQFKHFNLKSLCIIEIITVSSIPAGTPFTNMD